MAARSLLTPRLKLILGLLLAALALWWAMADVDAVALGAALRQVHPAWLVAAVLSTMFTAAAITARWWLLLDRPTPSRFALLFHAVIASHVANIVIPLRLGDGIRVVTASQAMGLGVARATSATVLERLTEVITAAAVALTVLALGLVPGWAATAVTNLAWVGGGVLAVLIVGLIGLRMARKHNLVGWLPAPGVWPAVVVTSGAVAAGSVLTNTLVFAACDVTVPLSAAVLLMITLQVGTTIVAVPGGLGVSQLVTVKTLGLWQVPVAEAFALSLVLYLVARLPKLAMLPWSMAHLKR